MRELKNVEERILDRALYLMGKKKSCDISIRAIAKEAGVNVSAINYYFRSKEEMVRLVKEFYIENTLAVLSILKTGDYEDEERLLLAANEIMEYALRFPGNRVIRLHSALQAGEDEVSSRIIKLSEEIIHRMRQLFQNVMICEDTELNYKYMMFNSAINYPTEYEEITEFDGALLMDAEARLTYLRLLIDSLKTKK